MFKNFWTHHNIVSKNIHHYDKLVNNINCKYVWKCSSQHIVNNYRKNVTSRHLEIGPGTGHFLTRQQLASSSHIIDYLTLIDINPDILEYSKTILDKEYTTTPIQTINHNIFSNTIPTKYRNSLEFNSVGINYVLHCIPGKLENKLDTLLNNLISSKASRSTDKSSFTLFGSTVICDPLHMNTLAEYELMLLNGIGIFHNDNDTFDELSSYLNSNNIPHNLTKKGYVAIFSLQV